MASSPTTRTKVGGLVGGLLVAQLDFSLTGHAGHPVGGLIFGLVFGLVGGLVSGAVTGLIFTLVFASGLACGLLNGADALDNYILRVLLWRNDYAPWNYIQFLDYAVYRVFLRKIGDKYIFTHPVPMEFFAMRQPTDQVGQTKPA